MNSIDPVILELQAKVGKYNADIAGAQRLTDQRLGAIEARGFKMGQGLKKGFDLAKGAALTYAAALSVDAVVGAIARGLEYASALGEQAQQLGVTSASLQEYRYAASQAGLSSEEMDLALTQLTRRLGEAADGTKAQEEAFAKLGIKIRDSNGDILDAGEAIPVIAEALRKVESPAERAAILMDLFGKAGQKLEPLLAEGASGVNNLRSAAHKLGLVLSEEQIQKADETADKLAALKQVLEAKIASAVTDNADSILVLVDALGKLVDKAAQAVRGMTVLKRILADGKSYDDALASTYGAPVELTFTRQELAAKRAAVAARAPAVRAPTGFGTGQPARAPGLNLPAGIGTRKPTSGLPIGIGTNYGANNGPRLDPGQGIGLLGIDPGAAIKAVDEFTAEMDRMNADIAAAQAEISGSLQDRAAAEKRRIAADAAAEIARLQADDTVKKDKRNQHEALVRQKAALDAQLVDQRLASDLARQSLDQREALARLETDALSAEADMTANRRERAATELRILEFQQEIERARLEEAIAAGAIADAAKARAALARKQSAERGSNAQDNESPGERYARQLADEAANIDDAFEEAATNGLDRLNKGLADSVKSALGLHGILGDIVGDFIDIAIRQALIKPLADSLFGGSSGGGGGGGFFGKLLNIGVSALSGGASSGISSGASNFASNFAGARASGGSVLGGQMYRVNEGASPGRVEGFIPQGSGQIVPLGRMNAMASRGVTLHQTIHVDARGVNPDGYAEHIKASVRQETLAIVGQGMSQVNKGIPQRITQFQRDGN